MRRYTGWMWGSSIAIVSALGAILARGHTPYVPISTVRHAAIRRPTTPPTMTPIPTPPPPGSPVTANDIATTVAGVERNTERVRGLHVRRQVPLTLLGAPGLKQFLGRSFDAYTSDSDVRYVEQPLVLLGILSAAR